MISKLSVGLIVMVTFVFSGAASVGAQETRDVIHSAQSRLPGIRTELVEVKRMSDNTIRVQWRWRNTTNQPISVVARDYTSVFDQTYLLDPVNKKKHVVVTDAKGTAIGSPLAYFMEIAANQETLFWVKFPAPPASVGKVSVVIAQTPPFEDVAISN